MQLELHPPTRVGPVLIGAPAAEAEAGLASLGEFARDASPQPGFFTFESGLSIALHADHDGTVIAVEVYKPTDDQILLDGVDVFQTPADDMIALLETRTPLRRDEDGCMIISVELSMGLWREDPDEEFFASALVGHPGYYARPGDLVAQ